MNNTMNMSKWFDVLYFTVLENHGWSQVQKMQMVDYFNKNGVVFTNWTASCHPSGPNYRTLFSGNHWSYNEFDDVARPNIGNYVDVVVQNFKNAPADRHNPFKDMHSTNLCHTLDVTKGGIWYYGLDDNNDGHSASLDIADNNVLQMVVNVWQQTLTKRWVFFVVFDEAFGIEWANNHVFAGMITSNKLIKQIHSPMRHENFAMYLYNNWNINPPEEILPPAYTYKDRDILTLG